MSKKASPRASPPYLAMGIPGSILPGNPTTTQGDQLLTEKLVAQITGLSLSKLRHDRFKGIGIPYVKFGRAVRYMYKDVISHAYANRIETES